MGQGVASKLLGPVTQRLAEPEGTGTLVVAVVMVGSGSDNAVVVRTCSPSMKVTVPVGVVPSLAESATEAVKVTSFP
jgi:hypothetical protein